MGYELEMEDIREENSIDLSPPYSMLRKPKDEMGYELEMEDIREENSIDLSPLFSVLRKLKETMFKYLKDSKIP